jgi:hypothetical protein
MNIYCNVLVRDGVAYIPTSAKSGYLQKHIEPVEVASVSDTNGFCKALKDTVNRGNPSVTVPSLPANVSDWVVLKHAKVKSLRAFQQNAQEWHFTRIDETWQFEQWQKVRGGGWIPAPGTLVKLPAGIELDVAISEFVSAVQRGQNAGGPAKTEIP